MHLPTLEYHEADTLDQAAGLMAQHGVDARLMAGGTDILVDLKTERFRVRHLVSLSKIKDLRGIEVTEGGIRIGAMTTIGELLRSTVVNKGFTAILEAAGEMAATQIRNMATIGGNLAGAVPCADLPPILMCMNASVKVWSPRGYREFPLEELYKGPRETVLGEDEILVAILVPAASGCSGAAYERFALRNGNAIAVAGVAVGLELDEPGGKVMKARMGLAAVSPTPRLVDGVSEILVGQRLTDEVVSAAADLAMGAATPISDIRGSAAYRREVVGVLARRALERAYHKCGEVKS